MNNQCDESQYFLQHKCNNKMNTYETRTKNNMRTTFSFTLNVLFLNVSIFVKINTKFNAA